MRIFPLYILGTILALIAVLAGRPFEGSVISAVALNTFLLPYFGSPVPFPLDSVAWSLFFEVFINVFYATFLRQLTRTWLFLIMAVCALGLVVWALINGNLDIGWNRRTFLGGFLRVGYSFFVGVLIYRAYIKRPWQISGVPGTVFSLLLIGIVSATMAYRPENFLLPIYEISAILFVFPMAAFVAVGLKPIQSLENPFKLAGLLSYPVYVLAMPIGSIYRHGILRLSSTFEFIRNVHAPWLGAGFIAVMVIVSWLANKWYDVPIRRVLLHLPNLRTVRQNPT